MDRHCAHRQASLLLARNEDNGLRCLYHGWKFDIGGKAIEMPSEPAGTCDARNVRLKSYPTHEYGGFVWAYMGPRESMSEFAPPAWAPTVHCKISIVKIKTACNWAQVTEGSLDSSHSSNLHSSEILPTRGDETRTTSTHFLRPSTDKAPRIETQATSYGFKYAAIRRPTVNANSHDYIRTTLFVAPFTVLIPPNNLFNVANVNVPIDDTNTIFYFMAWSESPSGAPDQEEWRRFCGAQVGIDLDRDFNNRRTSQNNYLQDRLAMKNGNFTGIRGIPQQDIAMTETMGAITDRSKDLLGAGDVAIVQFRRQAVEMVKRFQEGEHPLGTRAANAADYVPQTELRSFQAVVPKGTQWRGLDTVTAQRERAASLSGIQAPAAN